MAVETIKSEDFIEYFLFPKINQVSEDDERDALANLLQTIDEISNNFIKSYIWHKDSFNLKVRTRSSHLLKKDSDEEVIDRLPPHLHGISFYGDNVQDEWFIVALLYHISRTLPGLIIRTCDSDGEFLLIEAAELLPEWADPESCENAVYIYDGHILLLKNHQSEPLSVSSAIDMIRINPKAHQVSEKVDKAVYERIKKFPDNLGDNFHNQVVYVPVAVAALLRSNPQFIAPAVQAFCYRDPIDMKACRAMRYFPPENRVNTSVKFTKCLYAMLMHNNYLPDRRTGWQIPSATSAEYKSHILGVKLASGFEILASQVKTTSSDDVEDDREWSTYLESLNGRKYFRDLMEGSKGYKELYEQAKEFYVENRDALKITPKVGRDIVTKLKELEINVDEFRHCEATLPESDSDDWLNIDVGELDEMLTKRYGIKNLLSTDQNANSGQLTGMLSNFLDKKSEFDGVDLNSNVPSVDSGFVDKLKCRTNGQSSHEKMVIVEESKTSTTVDFNPDAFASIVKNMLDLVIPEDNWESASDMSDDYESDEELMENIDDISSKPANKSKKKKKSVLASYMEQMDQELAKTSVGKSFETKKEPSKASMDDFDDVEDFQPVDIDRNAVKNMMESFKMQGSSAGPATNLINSIMEIENKETNV